MHVAPRALSGVGAESAVSMYTYAYESMQRMYT